MNKAKVTFMWMPTLIALLAIHIMGISFWTIVFYFGFTGFLAVVALFALNTLGLLDIDLEVKEWGIVKRF